LPEIPNFAYIAVNVVALATTKLCAVWSITIFCRFGSERRSVRKGLIQMTVSDKRYDVIGLGVSTLDLLMLAAELPGEEIVQRAHQSVLQGGGPVATAMVTLARLGSRTAMIDRIGDDWRGRLIIDEFRKEKVSTEHIRVVPGSSSSIASITVRRRDGARAIIYSPGDCGALQPEELSSDVISESGILHLNGRHWDACLKAARIARASGVKVSFDGGAFRHRDDIYMLLELTDICIVARQFAFAFSGVEDVELASAKLMQAGPEIVVVTSGTRGSLVVTKHGDSFQQPAFDIGHAVDTTGAGDAYHGAFLHGMLTGLDLRGCATLASAVAAMNTRELGGRGGIPTLDEARAFIAMNERA
jgi:sulfofructose kinase